MVDAFVDHVGKERLYEQSIRKQFTTVVAPGRSFCRKLDQRNLQTGAGAKTVATLAIAIIAIDLAQTARRERLV